jgi:hypothetical protein
VQIEPTKGCVYLENCHEECGENSCVASVRIPRLIAALAALAPVISNETAACKNLASLSPPVVEEPSGGHRKLSGVSDPFLSTSVCSRSC